MLLLSFTCDIAFVTPFLLLAPMASSLYCSGDNLFADLQGPRSSHGWVTGAIIRCVHLCGTNLVYTTAVTV